MKYEKKTTTVEAFQMTKERRMDNSQWPEWLNRAWNGERNKMGTLQRADLDAELPDEVVIVTYGGAQRVAFGDWLVLDQRGEVFPYQDGVFKQVFDRVNPDRAALIEAGNNLRSFARLFTDDSSALAVAEWDKARAA